MIRMPASRESAINTDDETTVRRGAWGTRTFASVRRRRRAQGGSPTLRSIRPKRATRWLGTSVEPSLLKRGRHRPGDPVLPGCPERAGVPLVLREDPPDHRAARAIVLPRSPEDVEADRAAGL